MSLGAGESYLFEALMKLPRTGRVLSLCLGQEVPAFADERDLVGAEAAE